MLKLSLLPNIALIRAIILQSIFCCGFYSSFLQFHAYAFLYKTVRLSVHFIIFNGLIENCIKHIRLWGCKKIQSIAIKLHTHQAFRLLHLIWEHIYYVRDLFISTKLYYIISALCSLVDLGNIKG